MTLKMKGNTTEHEIINKLRLVMYIRIKLKTLFELVVKVRTANIIKRPHDRFLKIFGARKLFYVLKIYR